jgi:hypothetical protein
MQSTLSQVLVAVIAIKGLDLTWTDGLLERAQEISSRCSSGEAEICQLLDPRLNIQYIYIYQNWRIRAGVSAVSRVGRRAMDPPCQLSAAVHHGSRRGHAVCTASLCATRSAQPLCACVERAEVTPPGNVGSHLSRLGRTARGPHVRRDCRKRGQNICVVGSRLHVCAHVGAFQPRFERSPCCRARDEGRASVSGVAALRCRARDEG